MKDFFRPRLYRKLAAIIAELEGMLGESFQKKTPAERLEMAMRIHHAVKEQLQTWEFAIKAIAWVFTAYMVWTKVNGG